jgi:hypothetical protein
VFSHKFQQVCTRVRPSLKDITWSRCIFNYHLMQSPSSVPWPRAFTLHVCL